MTDLGPSPITDLDAGEIFSGQPSGRIIKGYAAPCAHTPMIEPDHTNGLNH